MATLAQQIAAIDDAIAKGRAEVQEGDVRVRYHSMREMLDARARLMAELTQASAAGGLGIGLVPLAHGDAK
ncbi:MAG TPA: hypothetical protein VLL76_07675 [Candidatus Omnitrophota bacterium]|nr:hypothetical protein [Candidatus Omnitrophota bacterium]